MEGLSELIRQYRREAARLYEYRKKLSEMIANERCTEKLHELELRKATVEAERYEIIADIKEMTAYENERKGSRDRIA